MSFSFFTQRIPIPDHLLGMGHDVWKMIFDLLDFKSKVRLTAICRFFKMEREMGAFGPIISNKQYAITYIPPEYSDLIQPNVLNQVKFISIKNIVVTPAIEVKDYTYLCWHYKELYASGRRKMSITIMLRNPLIFNMGRNVEELIFSYLDFKTKICLMQTCRRCNNMYIDSIPKEMGRLLKDKILKQEKYKKLNHLDISEKHHGVKKFFKPGYFNHFENLSTLTIDVKYHRYIARDYGIDLYHKEWIYDDDGLDENGLDVFDREERWVDSFRGSY